MASEQIEITAVGDVVLDRTYPIEAFDLVRNDLQQADLLVGNQEGPLAQSGEQAAFTPWANMLSSPAEMADGLESAGFDVLSLANNQSMNYGPSALRTTIEALTQRDIAVVGAGRDKSAAEEAVSRRVDGIDVGVVAFESTKWDWKGTQALDSEPGLNQLSISPYLPDPMIASNDMEKMKAIVGATSQANDVLITMFHFGLAGEYQISKPQRALAHGAVEAGADAVIGAHSHTVQEVEVYQSTPIFYSLGNFVFDQPETWSLRFMESDTLMVTVRATRSGVSEAIIRPATSDSGERDRPMLLDPGSERYEDVVDHLFAWTDAAEEVLERRDDHLAVRF